MDNFRKVPLFRKPCGDQVAEISCPTHMRLLIQNNNDGLQCREDVKVTAMQGEIFRQGIGQTMKPSVAFVQPAEFPGYRQYSAESEVKTSHLVYSHGRKSEHRKGIWQSVSVKRNFQSASSFNTAR